MEEDQEKPIRRTTPEIEKSCLEELADQEIEELTTELFLAKQSIIMCFALEDFQGMIPYRVRERMVMRLIKRRPHDEKEAYLEHNAYLTQEALNEENYELAKGLKEEARMIRNLM